MHLINSKYSIYILFATAVYFLWCFTTICSSVYFLKCIHRKSNILCRRKGIVLPVAREHWVYSVKPWNYGLHVCGSGFYMQPGGRNNVHALYLLSSSSLTGSFMLKIYRENIMVLWWKEIWLHRIINPLAMCFACVRVTDYVNENWGQRFKK